MIYPKAIKRFLILLCLSLLSINSYAQLKPYKAVYDIYSNGFHLGEATQTLIQRDNTWLIMLSSKATGFASFFQSKPATEEQLFSLTHQQPALISAKSDSGENEDKAKKSAYYDRVNKLLHTRIGNQSNSVQVDATLSSYLLLPITAVTLQNNHPINVTLYDDGSVIQKIMSLKSQNNKHMIVDIYAKQSNKRLRYIFKNNNLHVPFRIERFKNNELTAYLELKSYQ